MRHLIVDRYRNLSLTTEELEERGQRYFDSTYGDTAVAVYGLLEGAFPDLGSSRTHLTTFARCANSFLFRLLHENYGIRIRLFVR